MLLSLETDLLNMIKASPIAAKVREVDSLPDLDGKSLVQRFNTAAPAIYSAPSGFSINDNGLALPRFGIAVVAKNSAGQKAARQGDGIVMGLYDMIDALLGLFNFATGVNSSWRLRGVEFVHDELLFANGIFAAVIRLEGGEVTLPNPIDDASLAALAHFTTFHADYDIAPMASPSVETAWSQGDYTGGQPKAQDDVTPLP